MKLAIKPHYNKGRINKDEYKDIMRRAVPKVGAYVVTLSHIECYTNTGLTRLILCHSSTKVCFELSGNSN